MAAPARAERRVAAGRLGYAGEATDGCRRAPAAAFPVPAEDSAMRRPFPSLAALLAAATLALLGQAEAAEPATLQDGHLVDARGMTLYSSDKDPVGKSDCNGPCAANWPPLAARADAEEGDDWTLVQRDDGSWQWAYYGRPLYTFAQDKKPGDMLGDGKLGSWHVVKPEVAPGRDEEE